MGGMIIERRGVSHQLVEAAPTIDATTVLSASNFFAAADASDWKESRKPRSRSVGGGD